MGTIYIFPRCTRESGSLLLDKPPLWLPFMTLALFMCAMLRERSGLSISMFGTHPKTYIFDPVCSDGDQNRQTHIPLVRNRQPCFALCGGCVFGLFWLLTKNTFNRMQTGRSCPVLGTGIWSFCRTRSFSSSGPVEQNDFANRSFAILFVGARSHGLSLDACCLEDPLGRRQQASRVPYRQTHSVYR